MTHISQELELTVKIRGTRGKSKRAQAKFEAALHRVIEFVNESDRDFCVQVHDVKITAASRGVEGKWVKHPTGGNYFVEFAKNKTP